MKKYESFYLIVYISKDQNTLDKTGSSKYTKQSFGRKNYISSQRHLENKKKETNLAFKKKRNLFKA